MTTTEKTEIVKVDPAQYGLESDKAAKIADMFKPMLDKMVEMEKEYNKVAKLEMSPEKAIEAKKLRLQYVKVRTGTAAIHKELKAFYLAGGRFVDGWKNAQLQASAEIEDRLKSWEEHYEREWQAKIDARQEERAALLEETDMPPTTGLGEMEDAVWENLLAGARAAKKARLDAEAKAEEERLEAERKEREEQERVRVENERLKAEAASAEKRRLEEEAKIEAERKEQEAKLAAERAEQQAKLDAERAKHEATLRAEREKAEKAEAELKARERAEAEEKARLDAEREAREQAELAKGDAQKMADLCNELLTLKTKYRFESDSYRESYERAGNYIDTLIAKLSEGRGKAA